MILKLGTSAFMPNFDWFLVRLLDQTHVMAQIFMRLKPVIVFVFIVNSGLSQLQENRLLLRLQSANSNCPVFIRVQVYRLCHIHKLSKKGVTDCRPRYLVCNYSVFI